jgi:hypothetical protein
VASHHGSSGPFAFLSALLVKPLCMLLRNLGDPYKTSVQMPLASVHTGGW